jgi:uncharacterized membrane protein YbhN (UPF0104 family)
MDQVLRNSIGSGILAIVIGMIAGVGIAILYIRYLRRLRIPARDRTGVDTYGLLILGIIAILLGSGGIIFLFYAYPNILTIVVLLLSLLFFTAWFAFAARRGYKRSL